MPIYEYVCHHCGHEFEWLTGSDEKPTCPNCGMTQLGRKFSAPAAHTTHSEPTCPVKSNCETENCCGQRCFLKK